MDKRTALDVGTALKFGGTDYAIIKLIGRGANSLVYSAEYPDNVTQNTHYVLIKELFPYHVDGEIYRGESSEVIVSKNAESFFEKHRSSFLRGNSFHVDFQRRRADKVCININTFAENNTLYTVVAGISNITLESIADKITKKGAAEAASYCLALINELDAFHKNGALHLDISPDNIIVLPEGTNGEKRLMLIDYNSVSIGGMKDNAFFSVKDGYSAPELKTGNSSAVCEGTDLYSVCAVFYRLACGFPMDEKSLYTKAPVIPADLTENLPAISIDKANEILQKGLRFSPKNRYASCAELFSEFRELIDRTEGVGISHAALWESSKRTAQSLSRVFAYQHIFADKSMLPCMLLAADGTLTAPEKLEGCAGISGPAGIGKTTALLLMLNSGTTRYNRKKPVPIYIPLSTYGGEDHFIEKTILQRLKFSLRSISLEEARLSLEHLFMESNTVTLLLDGLNEAPIEKEKLWSEIKHLSSSFNIGVIVTERVSSGDDYPPYTVAPLEAKFISPHLAQHGLLYPESADVGKLLENPMLLTLYERVCNASESAFLEISSADELIRLYIDALLSSENSPAATFAVKFVLSLIAAKMSKKKRPTITQKELYELFRKTRRLLRLRSFPQVFTEYAGKVAEIMPNKQTDDEFFAALETILTKTVALLRRIDNSYCFIHSCYLKFFTASVASDKRFREFGRKRKIYAGAFILAAAVFLSAMTVNGTVGASLSAIGEALTDHSDDYIISDGVLMSYSGEGGKVTVPEGVTEIISSAFGGNSSITSVLLPSSLMVIRAYAFSDCVNLCEVKLSGCEEIDDYAFSGCVSLTRIEIPASTVNIGANPFADCSRLEEIFAAYRNESYASSEGALYTEDMSRLISYPAGLKAETPAVPLTLSTVSNDAFYGNSYIKTLIITENIESIQGCALSGMTNLESISVSEANKHYKSESGVLYSKDKKKLIAYPMSRKDESFSVSEGIEHIEAGAFSECAFLQRISLPNSLSDIGDQAFYLCRNLKSVTFGEGVNYIGAYAFSGCSALETLSLPNSVSYIGRAAFENCSELQSAELSDALDTIPEALFINCPALESIIIPDGVKTIENEAFLGCSGLKSAELPEGLTKIGSAFTACRALSEISLPSSLTEIGGSAFMSCENLESIEIPRGVALIPSACFMFCGSLKTVFVQGSPTVVEDAFLECPAEIIYV